MAEMLTIEDIAAEIKPTGLDINDIKMKKVDELKNVFDSYLIPGDPDTRLEEKLGDAIKKIFLSVWHLFQVDTFSLWYARNDFTTKEGVKKNRIVFLDGVGAYAKLKDKETLKNIKNDEKLGEYPNYKFFPNHREDPDREKCGTSYVATYGIQIVKPNKSSGGNKSEEKDINLNDLQATGKGKYDEYIYGTGEEAKAFDYFIIQPLIYNGEVIGVLKIEKRANYKKTPEEFKYGNPLFEKLLICLNQITPAMAQALEAKSELIRVMEYGSPGVGYAINLDELDNHNITMRLIKEYQKSQEIYNKIQKELNEFINGEIYEMEIQKEGEFKKKGKELVMYNDKPNIRIKTIQSLVEKIIRKRKEAKKQGIKELDTIVSAKNVFNIFKDLIGVRFIFRFLDYRNEFSKCLEEKLKAHEIWKFAAFEKDFLTGEKQKNPRNTVDDIVDESGYRAIHIWIQRDITLADPGSPKIKKVIIEIQMRTLMEDAWAQKAHPLIYKDKWRMEEMKNRSTVEKIFRNQSNSLASVDDTTEQIKLFMEE